MSSPTLPNGCGWELNGPSLYRDQGKASDVQRRGANRATKEGKASGRSDRHCHLPSASGEARGACKVQGDLGHVLEENMYPYHNQRATAYHGTPRTKTAIRGRRPSLPETNSMAGRTCVRNDEKIVTKTEGRNDPITSGETREEKERDKARGQR